MSGLWPTLSGLWARPHPDTLISRNNLALAYQDAGRLDEAKDLLNQSESGS